MPTVSHHFIISPHRDAKEISNLKGTYGRKVQ
jgi:hypothetical protein